MPTAGELGCSATPAKLEFVFFFANPKLPGSGFGGGLELLVDALNTDIDWLREYTRYLHRAAE